MARLSYNTHDPRGYKIFLYDDLYNRHIKYRHLKAEIEHILGVIENPDFITNDLNFSSRENYYARGVLPDAPNFFLKVCVETAGDSRTIVTSFEADRPKSKEQVLWRR